MTNITILTYFSNYNNDIIKRYIGTLYDTGFTGNVIVFTEFESLKIVEELKGIYNKLRYEVVDKPVNIHTSNYRVKVFKNWIDKYNNNNLDYELRSYFNKHNHYFLITDIRDVMFQKNPEHIPLNIINDIIIFQEDTQTGYINESIEMKSYLQNMTYTCPYYIESMNLLTNKYIIDSGVFFIKENKASIFFDTFYSHMCQFENTSLIKSNKLYQALLNYLIYSNRYYFLYINLLSNINEIVYNIFLYMNVNHKGYFVTDKGIEPYIIHHFDRIPIELKKFMSRKIKNGYYNFVCNY